MELREIPFEMICCGHCERAEIKTATGFAAVSRDLSTNAYTVRTYGQDQMPVGDVLEMTESEFSDWLAKEA